MFATDESHPHRRQTVATRHFGGGAPAPARAAASGGGDGGGGSTLLDVVHQVPEALAAHLPPRALAHLALAHPVCTAALRTALGRARRSPACWACPPPAGHPTPQTWNSVWASTCAGVGQAARGCRMRDRRAWDEPLDYVERHAPAWEPLMRSLRMDGLSQLPHHRAFGLSAVDVAHAGVEVGAALSVGCCVTLGALMLAEVAAQGPIGHGIVAALLVLAPLGLAVSCHERFAQARWRARRQARRMLDGDDSPV